MPLGEHLEELRRRIILGLIGPLIFVCIVLVFGKEIIGWLTRPLLVALHSAGLPPQEYPTTAMAMFNVYLKVSLIGGLILGLPWLVYQLWLFVAPGLYAHERKFVTMLVPGSVVLTLSGLAFMYYVMLPLMLWFFIGFTLSFGVPSLEPGLFADRLPGQQQVDVPSAGYGPAALGLGAAEPVGEIGAFTPARLPVTYTDPMLPKEGDAWIKLPEGEMRYFARGRLFRQRFTSSASMATPLFHIEPYISMVVWLGLAFAIAFQLPLVLLLLGWVGIARADRLRRGRRFAFLGCFVVGMLLTPADPISMIALALPLYFLYELGVVLVQWFVTVEDEAGPEDEDEPDGEATARDKS